MAFFRLAAIAAGFLALPAGASDDTAVTAPALSIVSWNLDGLPDSREIRASYYWMHCASDSWQSSNFGLTVPSCMDYARAGIRSTPDLETKKIAPLRLSLARLAEQGVGILSVQHVRNAAALESVLPRGYAVVCMTTGKTMENVGYAARADLVPALTCREIAPFGRRGSPNAMQLNLSLGSQRIALLNIRLKAGCPTGAMDLARSGDCRALQQQAATLEKWIEAQSSAGLPFAIVGDWGRDLEQEANAPARINAADPRDPVIASQVRNLFPEVNDGAPANSAMVLAASDRSAVATCDAHVAHAVLSKSLVEGIDPSTLADGVPRGRMLNHDGRAASRFCAFQIEIRAR